MKVGDTVLHTGETVRILYKGKELVGVIEFIDTQLKKIRGTWSEETINPLNPEVTVILLRTVERRLTKQGAEYNSLHPHNTI